MLEEGIDKVLGWGVENITESIYLHEQKNDFVSSTTVFNKYLDETVCL